MNSNNQTIVRQGPNLKTLNETPAEHIMKNLDAYKGYTRYDMEQLVLNPSGYTLYDGNNRNAVYKKDGAEDITLLFRNGELKDAKITSSRKPIKSSFSLHYRNDDGEDCVWDIYDTREEAEEQIEEFKRKKMGPEPWSCEIIENSRKLIKSSKSVCIGFNTDNGTLLWKRDDLYTLDGSSIRQTKRKDIADKWIEKYNLNTTDTERLNKYTEEGIGQIPWGLPLVEDKDQTNYNKKLASILPPHNLNSSYGNNPLPTERDYRDFVDKLNNYCKNMKFSYGPMYEFEYEPEEGMSNDGWGHEYPNFRIYDTQGNLDMFSDDSIVKYIRDELRKKGWYPEAVHSSSDFTIAVE